MDLIFIEKLWKGNPNASYLYVIMTVNLVQINLQKSKQALNNFYSFLVRNPNTLGIIQEPYSYNGKIPKNREISIFGNQAGRAVLFAPKHIPIFACSEMCFEN